jgi:hypothetical protein
MTLRTECKIVTSELVRLFLALVRTRSAVSSVDLGTRCVIVCVVSLVAGRSGGEAR